MVGAGPAGLVAAITLARAGHRVEVLERHKSVGHRFHGDVQGLENWSAGEDVLDRLHRLGIETDFAHRGFNEVTFYDSRLHPVTARTRRPLFYLVRRGQAAGTLDSALLRQARAAGAEVRFGETARAADPGTIVATGSDQADGIAAGLIFRTELEDQVHAIVHPTLPRARWLRLPTGLGRTGDPGHLPVPRPAAVAAGARRHHRGLRAARSRAAGRGCPPVRGIRRASRAHPLRRRVGPAVRR